MAVTSFSYSNGFLEFKDCDCGTSREVSFFGAGNPLSVTTAMHACCPGCGVPIIPRDSDTMKAALVAESLGVTIIRSLTDIYGLKDVTPPLAGLFYGGT